MHLEIWRFYFLLLLWIILVPKCKGQTTLLTLTDDVCITDTPSAMAMIYNLSDPYLRNLDQFKEISEIKFKNREPDKIKSKCDETKYGFPNTWHCVSSFEFQRINNLITDRRWEDFPIYVTKSFEETGEILDYQHVASFPDSLFQSHKVVIPFSVQVEREAHVFLCDGARVYESNCYWFMLQAWKGLESGFRTCKKQEIQYKFEGKAPKNFCNASTIKWQHNNTNFPKFLSEHQWNHFKIVKTGNEYSLEHPNGSKIFTASTANFSIIPKNLFFHTKAGIGLWKVHQFNHYYREGPAYVVYTSEAMLSEGRNCLSIFTAMCTKCYMNIQFLRSKKLLVTRQLISQGEEWKEVKIKFNMKERIEDATFGIALSSFEKQNNFWAFTHPRFCDLHETRVLKPVYPQHWTKKCQHIETAEIVDIASDKNSTTAENWTKCNENQFGRDCLPCKLVYDRACPSNIKYCQLINIEDRLEQRCYGFIRNESENCKDIIENQIVIDPDKWSARISIKSSEEMCDVSKYIFIINNKLISKRTTDFTIDELEPFTEYSFNVYKDDKQLFAKSFKTKESEPQEPYDIKYNWVDENNLTVFWKYPNVTNGNLIFFNIWIFFKYDNGDTGTKKIYYPLSSREDYKMNYSQTTEVLPIRHLESLQISVIAHNTKFESENKRISVIYPPIPKKYIKYIEVADLILKIPKPEMDVFFESLYIFTRYMDKNETDSPPEATKELSNIHELLEAGNETKISETIKIHQLVRTCRRDDPNLSQNIIIIDGSNGLFKNNNKYKVIIYTVNELGGHRRVGRKALTVTTGKNSKIVRTSGYPILEITVGSLLILVLLAFGVYRCRYKFQRLPNENLYVTYENQEMLNMVPSESLECSGNRPIEQMPDTIFPGNPLFIATNSLRIKEENFPQYMENACCSNELLKQYETFLEEETKSLTKDTLDKKKRGCLFTEPRARNFLPVTLDEFETCEYWHHSDASFIYGYDKSNSYIVMRHPKEDAIVDFWRIVWQKKVTFILMLTDEEDKELMKQYWPDSNKKQLLLDDITITFLNTKSYNTHDQRKFNLCYQDCNPRKIYQLHFKEWPDQGVPLSSKSLIPIFKKLQYMSANDFPVIVHCSDGAGKSGTIILCDICLKMTAAEGYLDILATLEYIRSQRLNMVDTAERYKFAHFIILNYLIHAK